MGAVGTAPELKAHPATKRRGFALPESAQLVLCALGIYACYLNYGVLQEKIYKASYDGENFSYSTFLLAVQTFVNACGAFVMLKVIKVSAAIPPKSQVREYAVVALAYLMAMWFSFTALRYMSYPMQALGKSCKMIPVMLLGVAIRGRKYSRREYFSVLLITIGVALFSFKKSKPGTTDTTSRLGVILLLSSLFCDGITGPLQERLVQKYKPTSHQLMLWQNVAACIWLNIPLLLSGEGIRAAQFVSKHPAALKNILAFSLVSAVGQNFIFYTITHFSALAVTTITTTRKMFTILISILVFNHSIVPRQWAGLLLVFSAIGMEAAAKVQRKSLAEAKKKKSDEDRNEAENTQGKKAQ